jgi:hypothetical protein
MRPDRSGRLNLLRETDRVRIGVSHRGYKGAIVSETVGLSVDAPARLTLYVPHPESRLCTELAHGSAIVGLPLPHGEIRIYFEGNVIGASNLELYRARAAQAAGRMLHNYPTGYPTRAREDVDPRELVAVGTIESRTGRLEITASASDLSWWIGPADLADLGFRLEAR